MQDKIHIAFVIHDANPVPYFNWFAEKAKNSGRFRFTFIFLNKDNSAIEKRMQEYGFPVVHIPFDNDNKKISLVKSIFRLYLLFKKIRPDVVHSHLFYDGIIALRAAKWAGVKIRIQTKQSTGYNWYYAPKAVRFDRMKNRLATHLVAVSGEGKKFILEKEMADRDKVFLVNHGVDIIETTKTSLEHIRFLKQKFNPENKLMVIKVARYVDWKGYKYFIRAAAQVLEKNRNVIFLGVGTGPQELELQNLIDELNIQKDFVLTGFIDRQLIPSLYKASDVYVHAAIREPFGFVIAEAMLNELPLVTTPTGAAGDAIIHLENGYLVKYENENELADGIDYFCSLTAAERREFGKGAALTAQKLFTFEDMWNGYTAIYENALNKLKIGEK
jgi:glycosyltransferase involved in cell wall biosynthesis